MTLWVCIPVHNRWGFTQRCLQCLGRQNHPDFRVVVCDDGSTDGTAEEVAKEFPNVTLLSGSGNLWWTGAINRCVEYVRNAGNVEEDSVVTLNNDLEVDPDYLSALESAAARHHGCLVTSAGYDIASRQLVETGQRHSWLTAKSRPLDPARDHHPHDGDVAEVTHAPGRGTLVPLRVFQQIGLYDFRRLPHYAADYDFTFRARRAGYRVLICYSARVYSHVAATGMSDMRRALSIRDLMRYLSDRRSPANLNARWWFALNNCPWYLLPSYLTLDLFLVLGSYFRHHLRRAVGKPGRGN